MQFKDWRREKRERGITEKRRVHASEWIVDELDTSMGIFGGDAVSRLGVAMWGIVRYVGRRGIIVLHNDEGMDDKLKYLWESHAELEEYLQDISIRMVNPDMCIYKPLSGIPVSEIVGTIYSNRNGMENNSICEEILDNYLKLILECENHIDLPLLLKWIDKSPDELENEYGDRELARRILKKIRTRNGNDSYYDKVRADVRSVFRKLENKIWSEAAEDQERVSIAETIENGDILSIRIPDNDKYVLDYLFNELLYQLNHGRRFLLVVDELAVGMLDRLDMLKNPSLNVELIQSVPDFGNGESDSEWENIIYRLDDIILLNFPMARAAEPVARMVGRYWGKRITENKNKHRGARDWFAGHGHGTVESQDFYERIPPEMLTEIGDAAYLFSDEIYYARVIEW